jgi:hypothetical protein
LLLTLIDLAKSLREEAMSHVCSKLTRALAGLAVASLPVLAGAQSTTSSAQTPQQTPRPTTPTAEQSRSTSPDKSSPQHHLNEAKRVLGGITSNSTQIAELRLQFTRLETAWNVKAASAARRGASGATHAGGHVSTTGGTTSGTPSATTAGTTGTPEQAGATGPATARQTPGSSDTWMTHYQAIDGILDQLLGDTAAGVTASVSVDATTKTKLTEFRRHIDQFHTTAMAQSRVGEEDAASASTSSGITGAMTETTESTASTTPMPPTSTTASTTGTTSMTGTTGTTGTTGAAGSDQAAIARLTAQIDELLRGSTTTGASGAAATGTVCVDRAKLEQLKRDLQALRR